MKRLIYILIGIAILINTSLKAQTTVTLNADPVTANTVTFDPDMSPAYFYVYNNQEYAFELGPSVARTVTISTNKKIDISSFNVSWNSHTWGVSLAFYNDNTLVTTKDVNNGGTGIYNVSNASFINRIDIVSDGSSNSGLIDINQITFTISVLASPTVSTNVASSISDTEATLNGNVSSNGGASVTSRGFEYSTTDGFGTGTGTTVTSGSGTGSFSKAISGLTANTTYYYKAFATNSVGTKWGNQTSFTTDPPPAPEINISGNGVSIVDGDASPSSTDHTDFGSVAVDNDATQVRTFTITNTGTANLNLTDASPYVAITGHTSDFSLTANPSTPVSSGGGSTTFSVTFNPTATGTRSATISIANNDANENPYNFDIQGTGFTSPTVTSNSIASITATSAQFNGEITATGGQNPDTRGFVWNTATAPTTADNAENETGNYSTGTYSLSSNTLTSNTLYYVRAYAENDNGLSYSGNELTFTTLSVISAAAADNITASSATVESNITTGGGAAISARGICWNTTGTPTTADDKTTDGTGTGIFTSSMSNLTPNTTYYVRSYSTNAQGTSYSTEISFTTLDLSVAISNVNKNSDTEYELTADITNPSSVPITARGFVWSTSQNPTTASNSGSTSNGTGSSSYTDNATVTVGPGYYVRAYITTADATYYSDEIHFGVVPTLPEWGLIFLAAGFVLGGGWVVYRKLM